MFDFAGLWQSLLAGLQSSFVNAIIKWITDALGGLLPS